MSTINVNNISYLTSNENIPKEESKNIIVTHEQPLNSVQIHTQLMENSSLYSTMISSFNENSEIMSVAIVHDPKSNQQSFPGNIYQIHEYQLWSIFNLIFCCIILGIFALHMSCTTKKNKRQGNFIQAKAYSKLSALLNIIATFSGIIIYTIVAIRFIGYIDM